MAHTAQSQILQDLNATPVTKTNQQEIGGEVKVALGYLAAANYVAGTAGQTYAFTRLPKNARVLDIKYTNVSSGAAGSIKIGLFRPNDGIAIDDDCFATAVDLNTARQGGSVMALPLAADRFKDLETAFATAIGTAGATEDLFYDVVATVVTVATAGKDTLVEVLYVEMN